MLAHAGRICINGKYSRGRARPRIERPRGSCICMTLRSTPLPSTRRERFSSPPPAPPSDPLIRSHGSACGRNRLMINYPRAACFRSLSPDAERSGSLALGVALKKMSRRWWIFGACNVSYCVVGAITSAVNNPSVYSISASRKFFT
jgi:hypothetical protein